MKINNWDEYIIFCIHNDVLNIITDVRGNELQVANICSMLNSCKNACIDYLYCPTSEYMFGKYHELDLKESKQLDWFNKYCN